MLTVLHAEIIPTIRSFAGGLLTFRHAETGLLSLVVKAQKEAILAARMNGGFSCYVAPLMSTSGLTISLISAFFDDSDEPLIIASLLFADDQHSRDLLELLAYDEFDVYFFDDRSRELMSYHAVVEDGGSCLFNGTEFGLLTYHPETAKVMLTAVRGWFGLRTRADDEAAIRIVFEKALMPDDIFIMDLTIDGNDYRGSTGFSHDSLTRTDPGYFQESDIVAGLRRAFGADQVALNPRRRDTNKEILDVLVVTESHILLVQAKDSPNTETSLARALERKRRASHRQLADALRQVRGAARFLMRQQMADLVVNTQNWDVCTDGRTLIGIVVIKELFDNEGATYLEACGSMAGIVDGMIVMDYPSFCVFAHHFCSQTSFITSLERLIALIRDANAWVWPKDFVMADILARLDDLNQG
nr:hypothetical protein [uncultured Rhodopila sp.]